MPWCQSQTIAWNFGYLYEFLNGRNFRISLKNKDYNFKNEINSLLTQNLMQFQVKTKSAFVSGIRLFWGYTLRTNTYVLSMINMGWKCAENWLDEKGLKILWRYYPREISKRMLAREKISPIQFERIQIERSSHSNKI